MNMDLFNCKDYRDSVRIIYLSRAKTLGLTQAELAENINIRPPFLSKVFSKKAHFCREQLDLCLRSLKCQKNILEFVFLLFDFNLSKNFNRRESLIKELSALTQQPRSVSDYIPDSNSLDASGAISRYYCNPLYSLVHMALTIKEFRESPNLLPAVLKIDADQINKGIEALVDCGVASITETGKIHLNSNETQIERTHEQFETWRLGILGLMAQLESNSRVENSIKVQGFFAIPVGVNSKIKEKLVQLIVELKELSQEGPESKIVAINLNFFEVT